MNTPTNITRITSDTPQEDWNDYVDHPLQTWEWGEIRAEQGIPIVRFQEKIGREIVNYQLTIHKVPYTNFTIGYLPRTSIPSREVFEFLKSIAQEYNCIFIKCEPHTEKQKLTKEDSKLLQTYAQPSPHPLFPTWTQVLNLTPSEDELLANMKPKTRYNTRLGIKNGVVVKEMTSDEGFEIFQKLYFETCQRQKYRGHTYNYHKQLFQKLKGTIAHIIIAFYNDIPLAAYELFTFKNKLYYPYGGSSDRERNKMAANVIMWEAIRFGKQKGATTFDLWGSLPPDYSETNPWAGFTRFKEGYGAEFVEFCGSYDCVYKPVIYSVYGSVQKVRTLLLHR